MDLSEAEIQVLASLEKAVVDGGQTDRSLQRRTQIGSGYSGRLI